MRAYLEFELPEDDDEHRAATDGQELAFAIGDMMELFRRTIKYEGDETAAAHAAKWRDALIAILDERNLSWWHNR